MRIPPYQTKLAIVKQELYLHLEERLQSPLRNPLHCGRTAQRRPYSFPVLQNMWFIQTVSWSKLVSISLKWHALAESRNVSCPKS